MVPDELFLRFGEKVRQLRIEKKLSQEQLGFASGITMNFVSRIELGKVEPCLRVILQLARGLDVAPSALLDSLRA